LSKFRILLSAVALSVAVAGIQAQSVAAAETRSSALTTSVFSFAKKQLGKPFRLGANGMRRFDCSGLVYRTYAETGLLKRIGGNRTANGYFNWFKNRDRITRNPRPGDLVVWAKRGHRVSHIGIFKGYNRRGRAIALSALTGGVAVHKVHAINKPFKAYLRVDLSR
jgi:cell wall-associated NlpC family hydrolase